MTLDLPHKTTILLQIRAIIIFLIIEAGPLYMAIVLSPYNYIVVAAFLLLCLFMVFFYIPRFVRSTHISITKEGVVVKYGVFFKTEQIMPALRFIFMETHQTPLARAMGLCAVSFLGAKSRITVPEIDTANAKRLFNFVKSAAGEENE